MSIVQRLKFLEGQYMFIKWIGGNEYVKLIYSAEDFMEFNVIDIDTMEYKETMMIRPSLLMEVTYGGADVQRILAEMSCNLPSSNGSL